MCDRHLRGKANDRAQGNTDVFRMVACQIYEIQILITFDDGCDFLSAVLRESVTDVMKS
jgi:hypothetical protein